MGSRTARPSCHRGPDAQEDHVVSTARSQRRRALRHRTGALRQAGLRGWDERPDLFAIVATPLVEAFACGTRLASCVHLDGLSSAEDLEGLAVWAPAQVRSLV